MERRKVSRLRGAQSKRAQPRGSWEEMSDEDRCAEAEHVQAWRQAMGPEQNPAPFSNQASAFGSGYRACMRERPSRTSEPKATPVVEPSRSAELGDYFARLSENELEAARRFADDDHDNHYAEAAVFKARAEAFAQASLKCASAKAEQAPMQPSNAELIAVMRAMRQACAAPA